MNKYLKALISFLVTCSIPLLLWLITIYPEIAKNVGIGMFYVFSFSFVWGMIHVIMFEHINRR